MLGILHDVRQALRSLGRAPALAATVVLTLGLGVGLNTAVFGVVSSVLLRPLDYAEPERLVHVQGRVASQEGERTLFPGLVFTELREGASQLSDLAAATAIRQNLTGASGPVQVQVGWVSPNLFGMLGVSPAVGRDFAPDEAPGRLLLGHGFWTRELGADGEAVGRTLFLDGHGYEVVGVLPPGFRLDLPRFPPDVDVWKVPDDWWQNGDLWSAENPEFALLHLVGRLAPQASVHTAQSELDSLVARVRERNALWKSAGLGVEVQALLGAVVGEAGATLWLLLGAAGCVLLVACSNLTNLMLARGHARAREVAVRLALGGGRTRVARLILVEALLLSVAGGALGLLLASLGTEVLVALSPGDLPRAAGIRMDHGVLAFGMALAVGSTLVFGLLPALSATRRDLARDLRRGRDALAPRSQGAGRALVVAQVAVSLVLLSGAGLLGTSLVRLHAVDPGFRTDGLLTFSVSMPGARYERPAGTDRLLRALEDEIARLPGVESVGSGWPLPLSGSRWGSQYSAGAVPQDARALAEYRLATPGLFDTLGVRILEGRSFSPADARHSVVVGRSVAERAWAGRSAVGRTLLADPWGGGMESFAVVGVVEDVRQLSLRGSPDPAIYFDSRGWSWTDWEIDVAVRTSVAPSGLIEPIRAALARLDPEIPMAEVRPMTAFVSQELAETRFALLLIGLFAATALLLAVVGLYGVVSQTVGRRRKEFGIRVALGATSTRILRLAVVEGMALAVAGLALGAAGTLASSRVLGSLLYEVAPADPMVLAGACAVLAAASTTAALLPARRACRVDPIETLRAE